MGEYLILIEQGIEIPYQNSKMVLPGQEISKIPRITNCAQPCWIRVRLVYENSMEGPDGVEGLSDWNLYGMSKDWVKIGNYYYYTKILENFQIKKEVEHLFSILRPEIH